MTSITKTKKQRGATMVEYAIMVALIAVVAIATVQLLGQRTEATFQTAADAMS